MVEQIGVAGTAQVAQGMLETLVGWGALSMALLQGLEPAGIRGDPFLWVLSLTPVVVGPVRILAGRRHHDFRGRWLGLGAAVVGSVSIVCCCMPSAPLLLGFMILLHCDPQVREAFARRARGDSAADVRRWLNRPDAPRRAV